MPGHEFEKNVQQRLDELKLRPSDVVWKNVEYSIRKDKRRRRMILWLPILLLFLGTSGYLLINKNGFVSSETAIKNIKKNKGSKTTPPTKEENNAIKVPEQKQERPTIVELNQKNSQNETLANSVTNQKSNSVTKSSTTSKNKKSTKAIIASNNVNEDQISSSVQEINRKNESGDETVGYSNINHSLIKESITGVGLTIPENHQPTIQTPQVDVNSLTPPNANQKFKNSKWQWGLDFSIGTSTASSELSFLKSAQMDRLSVVGANVGGVNPQASGNSSTVIEPGMHWSAGGFVQRNFTNRFALSAGLQYSQYSTQIITSTRVDTNRVLYNNFAVTDPSGKSFEQSNRYYFIELPVTTHIKLNKSNNFPVFANAGLSIAWLLVDNSQNYNRNVFSNVQGNELYNKTQIGFHGGLTFGLLNKTKHPLQIGPSIRYNFSRLMKSSSSNQHLASFGLDARFFLKK